GQPRGPAIDAKAVGTLWRLRFDAGGRYLAAAGSHGVMAWALRQSAGEVTAEPFAFVDAPNPFDFALHPGGTEVVYYDRGRAQPVAYDLRSGEARELNFPLLNYTQTLDSDGSGRRLFFAATQGNVGVWDWQRMQVTETTAASLLPPVCVSKD